MSTAESADEFARLAQLDYRPLTKRVSRAEIRAYRAWARSSSIRFPNAVWPRIVSVARLLGMALVLLMVLSMAGLLLVLVATLTTAPILVNLGVGVGTIIAASICVYLILRGINRGITLRSPWPRRVRMSQFATANGFSYVPVGSAPEIPSTVFANDLRATATDRLVSRTGRRIEVGNVQRTIGDRVSAERFQWGYLAVSLDRSLPHIVLTTKVGRFRLRKRGIPAMFLRDQALRLEGDFDRYFTLHAPKGYEHDALYIFAPDLMALMIDEVAAMEVEIIDNWILFYSPVEFSLAKPATLERLFRIARVVGAKTLRQSARYNDPATGGFEHNVVAVPGRRLRQGVSILSIVIAVAWVVTQVMRIIYTLT